MVKFISIILISGLVQVQSGWDLLATTKITKGHDAFLNEEIDVPVFPVSLRKMNGQRITLEGYVIPLQQSGSQDYFVLSRYPYQSCFFCGAAGPETVVEVYSERTFKYTDQRVSVSGKLELNTDDPLHLFFILRDCSVQPL